MKRLKVLYTIPNFDTAGSGKVVYDLASGLNKSLFEVHIACSHNKGLFFEEVQKLNLPIHIIDTTVKLRPYYSLINRIRPFKKFIKEHKFDIVHSWNWSSDWTEVIGSKLGGAKFVFTKKAMSWGNVHWKIKSYLSDYIITINDEMTNYFPNKKNQKLIPLGIDTKNYKSRDKTKQIKITDSFKIITVANLVPVKGIEVLIDALKLIDNKEVELSIIGDDQTDYASELKKKVAKLNLEKKVFFSGKQMNIMPFLQDADLYVIPSYNEGMPMALVEAMSMRVPVLGSNISGIKFVLKDFKELLFDTGDSTELANKINGFRKLSDLERKDLGNRLRAYILDNFSMEKFLKHHEELYLMITKGNE